MEQDRIADGWEETQSGLLVPPEDQSSGKKENAESRPIPESFKPYADWIESRGGIVQNVCL